MKGTANDCRTVKTGSLRVCGSDNMEVVPYLCVEFCSEMCVC